MATIRNLIESCFSSYLTSGGITANIYQGFASGEKSTPAVIPACVSAEEEPIGSGNWDVSVEISIRDTFDTTETTFDALCAEVEALIFVDDLPAQLMAQDSGLTVYGTAASTKRSWSISEDSWIETIELTIHCNTLTNS